MNLDENYFKENFKDFNRLCFKNKEIKFSSKFLSLYRNKLIEKEKEKIIFFINNEIKDYINIINRLRFIYTVQLEKSINKILDKKEKLIIYNFGDKDKHIELLLYRLNKKLPIYCFNTNNCGEIILSILKNNYFSNTIGKYFNKITNICSFSNCCTVKNQFLKKYKLKEEYDSEKPLIYFGLNNNNDLTKIKNNNSLIFLIWNGNDCDINKKVCRNYIKVIKKNKKIINIATSDKIQENLNSFSVENLRLNLDLCEKHLFKPPLRKGKSIFVWNNNEDCNIKIISKLKKYYRNINFIFSNNISVPYEKLYDVYKECFIGLRLTNSDGNTDMIDEFEIMKIPIVHNFSDYGLKWKNIDDIINHIDNNKDYEFKEQVEVNIQNINNNYLKLIYNNISDFVNFLKKYSNILFLSSDSYENGALINFKEFYYFIKQKIKANLIIGQNIDSKLLFKYKPKLIITLNSCMNLKNIVNIPVVNLITNIYNDNLNRYYYENGSENFIKTELINNLINFDYVFANSPELKKIIWKYYKEVKILYTTFIPYYGKLINIKKKNIEYDIGVIYSDFKNKKNNLNFLKKLENKNVILIGKNSENYGLKSVGWVDSKKLQKYYEKINYLIVDTYLPGFNNAITQAIINNCLLNYRNIVDINSSYINIIKDEEYIICNTNVKIWENNLKEGIYMINGIRDKEIAVFLVGKKNERVSLCDILTNLNIYYEIIGYNNEILKPLEIQNLYYNMGLINFDMKKIGLGEIFDYYDNSSTFNVEILEKKFYYNLGKNRKDLNNKEFTEFILNNTDKIIDKKVLLISKKISCYGGNQKTALQLIKLLEKYYIVELISININDEEYDFEIDKLVDNIPNSYIIREKNKNNIIKKINNTNYELIINNKFDNIFEFIDKINKKMIVITHNSMDPFNKLIIDNKDKISKVCTINNFHREVLYKNGINNTAKIYNWIEKVGYNNKIKFTQKIAFVGRFSKEKNLHLLVKAFRNIYNLKLILIGDGNMEIDNTRNIEKMGYMDNDNILKTLKDCDYLILPSYTEGLPFVILEAMSIGIPCIYSKIAGSDEIIQDRGFTFELKGYEKCKYNMNWDVFEEVDKYKNENINNIVEVIKKAYRIPFNEYKIMSNKCIKFIRENYLKDIAEKRNKELLGIK